MSEARLSPPRGFLSPGNGGTEGGVKTIEAGREVSNFMKKETWKLVIQLIVSVLTAVATTLGVTSCM